MQQIGRYQIVEELGRGAMGVVYRALDPAIGRTIAIKSIRLREVSDSSEQQRLRDRLIREAQSAGILSHPNIVTIYDILEQGDVAHIFMEFVNGPSLEKMLSDGTLPDRDTLLSFLRQVAAGLDHANKNGIVHRDIKPANLMLHSDTSTGERTAKITDFGVAKFVSQQMTQSGAMMGTPNYMAPEQIQGTTVDGRTDEFSLAVVAYELLTGEKPFAADYLPTLFYRIAREDPQAPETLNSTLDPAVGEVLKKALSKEAAGRYETSGAFIEALGGALNRNPEWIPQTHASSSSTPTIAGLAADTVIIPGGSWIPPANPKAGSSADPIVQVAELPALKRDRRNEPEEKSLAVKLLISILACAVIGALITVWRTWEKSRGNEAPQAQAQQKPAVKPATTPSDRTQTASATPPANPPANNPAKNPPATAPATPPENTVAQNETPKQSNGGTVAPIPAKVKKENTNEPQPHDGTVQFSSGPGQARIVIDGNEGNICLTPCSLTLSAGRHTLTAALAGYAVAQRVIHVPDDHEVYVALEKNIGVLHLTSSPSGAAIYIDGKLAGQTPSTLRLGAGSHKLELVSGQLRHTETIDVPADSFETRNVRWDNQ